jgi:hypothetical protein
MKHTHVAAGVCQALGKGEEREGKNERCLLLSLDRHRSAQRKPSRWYTIPTMSLYSRALQGETERQRDGLKRRRDES